MSSRSKYIEIIYTIINFGKTTGLFPTVFRGYFKGEDEGFIFNEGIDKTKFNKDDFEKPIDDDLKTAAGMATMIKYARDLDFIVDKLQVYSYITGKTRDFEPIA